MANDNITPDTPNHAQCLRLIQDLHDLLRCAEKADMRFVNSNECIEFAYDWKFWADECANVLQIAH